ncbi:MAG TPA: PhoH family protein [Candidatus Moranbacteria bacterium]|nr:PhoH family protein [Candidatus Moranbacteria bacterium]
MDTESGNKSKKSRKNSGKKTFVLDTNVPIHDYTAPFTFEDNHVVIPIMVIEELDNMKSGFGLIPYSARKALKKIWDLVKGNVGKEAPLPGGGTLQVIVEKENYFSENNADNLIISSAIGLKNAGVPNVVVISKDTGVRIKAEAMGIPAQDYEKDKSSLFQKYGSVLEKDDYINGILSVRYQVQKNGEILRIWGKDENCPIRKRDLFGLSPKNIDQICAMDALTSPDIHAVALTGIAGSGKTLLALAASLHQATKAGNLFDRVIVARPTIGLGYDLGFLPGDIDEKIDPWMAPIYDNLEFLIKNPDDMSGGKNPQNKNYDGFQFLIDKKILKIAALQHMRGRTLPRTDFIIDESQNTRPIDVKTLATRLGEGSKIVFTGDMDQIDTPYLDAESNGLAHLIAKLINEPDFCYLNLKTSVRSDFADRMARLL